MYLVWYNCYFPYSISIKKYKGDFYIGGNIYSNHYNRFVPDDTNLLIEKRRKYYIAYTYDGNTNTAKLYINGIENSYTKEYEGNMDACNYFMINALESDGTKSGSAKYYQIRFYDRVLDEKDIKYNFDIDNDKYNIEK